MCVPVWPARLAVKMIIVAANAATVAAVMVIVHYSQWQHLLLTNASVCAPIYVAMFVHYDNHNPNRWVMSAIDLYSCWTDPTYSMTSTTGVCELKSKIKKTIEKEQQKKSNDRAKNKINNTFFFLIHKLQQFSVTKCNFVAKQLLQNLNEYSKTIRNKNKLKTNYIYSRSSEIDFNHIFSLFFSQSLWIFLFFFLSWFVCFTAYSITIQLLNFSMPSVNTNMLFMYMWRSIDRSIDCIDIAGFAKNLTRIHSTLLSQIRHTAKL